MWQALHQVTHMHTSNAKLLTSFNASGEQDSLFLRWGGCLAVHAQDVVGHLWASWDNKEVKRLHQGHPLLLTTYMAFTAVASPYFVWISFLASPQSCVIQKSHHSCHPPQASSLVPHSRPTTSPSHHQLSLHPKAVWHPCSQPVL